jgi:hypothetical protein
MRSLSTERIARCCAPATQARPHSEIYHHPDRIRSTGALRPVDQPIDRTPEPWIDRSSPA